MKKPFFRIALAGSLLFVCCLLGASDALAQKSTSSFGQDAPRMVGEQDAETTYLTFHYQVVEADGKTLDESRHECLVALSRYIGQTWKISGEAETDIRTENRNGQITESSVYSFHYKVKDEEVSVTSVKYDEYWEYVDYPGGGRYRCYVLFGVAMHRFRSSIV